MFLLICKKTAWEIGTYKYYFLGPDLEYLTPGEKYYQVVNYFDFLLDKGKYDEISAINRAKIVDEIWLKNTIGIRHGKICKLES